MNEKTLALLEFKTIQERVAACSLSAEAARIIMEDQVLRDAPGVEALKILVRSFLERLNSGDEEKRENLPDIGFLIPKLGVEGASLDQDEAYALGLFVQRGEALKKWLLPGDGPLQDDDPLGALAAALPDCSAIAREVFRILDHDGALRDLPELREIRRRIQRLTRDLENAAAGYTGNEEWRRMLQSPVPSQRDGRIVLAVKANFRGRIKGIVHEVSATGQTIFVEPGEIVEKNNDILIEQKRLSMEIFRLLREMTGRIAERRGDLEAFHQGILGLETIRARALYSREIRGHFAKSPAPGSGENSALGVCRALPISMKENAQKARFLPCKLPEEPQNRDFCVGFDAKIHKSDRLLALKQARHPLLGRHAVPIDFAMTGGVKAVIITGPNTGGKTVTLKTVGLFALMNQFGLALPADEGTILPVFSGVYADIGDEQSISQSLSTFSAHMTNIAAIAAAVTETAVTTPGNNSLVLLDELGSGTDPEEGGAIAMAILDHLTASGNRIIATTHHGILKNYGYTRPGVENASVEFDALTLSPTYRIVMGIPGESRAVEIAGRNGLPPEIIGRARSYLDEERSDVSALITELKGKREEAYAAAEQARGESERLREERRRADLRELSLRQKELNLKAGGLGNFRLLLSESRKTLENLVREVKEGELSREKTLKVKEFLGNLEKTAAAEDAALEAESRALREERRRLEEGSLSESAPAGKGAAAILAPGAEVLAGEHKRRGVILRAGKKGEWIVEVGSLKMSFPERDLIPAGPSGKAVKPQIAAADLAGGEPARLELSLRGMRLEEAMEALERQLDRAILSGLHGFAVIHGKGDGILQRAVHDFLKRQDTVADYYFSRPEMGGFGRTEVLLKT